MRPLDFANDLFYHLNYISLSFLLIMVASLIFILQKRKRVKRDEISRSITSREMRQKILHHIALPQQSTVSRTSLLQLQHYCETPIHKKILLNCIKNYLTSLDGDMKVLLTALFFRLNLQQVVLNKLNSPDPQEIITGIQECLLFEIKLPKEKMEALLGHPNYLISIQSIPFLFRLGDNGFKAFNSYFSNRSSWESVMLFDYIKSRSADLRPQLIAAYKSANLEQKFVLLQLIQHLKWPDLLPAIVRNSPLQATKMRARLSKIIFEYEDHESLSIFQDLLKDETTNNSYKRLMESYVIPKDNNLKIFHVA